MEITENHPDIIYQNLLKDVLKNGKRKDNRTGTKTIGVFGRQVRFDLSKFFPLLTTKKIYFKAVVHELIWFLSGSTNIKYLVDNGVHIWDAWSYEKYRKTPYLKLKENELRWGKTEDAWGETDVFHFTQKEFIEKIKSDNHFAEKWGELGEGTYGGMWRAFPYVVGKEVSLGDVDTFDVDEWGTIDQISNLVEKLKTNPDDRRMIVSAWHPYWSEKATLAPCHCLFQFHTEELTDEERYIESQKMFERGTEFQGNPPARRLNCQLYQRSCDLFLGVPFNIASYALLTHMVAQVVNMIPGTFIHTFGDLHLYENHLNQVDEQLNREPRESPKLYLNPEVKNIFEFKFEDIKIDDYNSHPTIKAEVSV